MQSVSSFNLQFFLIRKFPKLKQIIKYSSFRYALDLRCSVVLFLSMVFKSMVMCPCLHLKVIVSDYLVFVFLLSISCYQCSSFEQIPQAGLLNSSAQEVCSLWLIWVFCILHIFAKLDKFKILLAELKADIQMASKVESSCSGYPQGGGMQTAWKNASQAGLVVHTFNPNIQKP